MISAVILAGGLGTRLRSAVPAWHHLEFPEAVHVHFYGFYIGNFPDLINKEVDEISAIMNSV